MIPTFNCANYLRQTLESVLAQDPGPEQMQIEVVDDCSTKDDPEAVVKEVGKGRVAFYRKPKNEGAIPNFNTCIERSRGELVHILHGDDWVLDGFYEEIFRNVNLYNECSLYATRVFFVTEEGYYIKISPRIQKYEISPTEGLNKFWSSMENGHYGISTPLQFAGNVVKRSFYELYGGFYPRLVHTADMEMWFRNIFYAKAIISPRVLGAYRCFEGNDTSKLNKSAENLRDIERFINLMSNRDKDYSSELAFQNLINNSHLQANFFKNNGDLESLKNVNSFIEERCPKTPLQILTMKLAFRSRIRKFLGK